MCLNSLIDHSLIYFSLPIFRGLPVETQKKNDRYLLLRLWSPSNTGGLMVCGHIILGMVLMVIEECKETLGYREIG